MNRSPAHMPSTAAVVIRSGISLVATLCIGIPLVHAAPSCPVPFPAPGSTDQIKDWYESYLKPFRMLAGTPEASPAPVMLEQAEALIERLDAYNRRAVREPLFFEPLVQQITLHYARSPDVKGLDTLAARKIHKPGSGPALDFSMMCIDTRTIRLPEDTFAITLFGVNNSDCQHVGLRGLVFTDTLVNGAASAECRPDHVYYKQLIFPIRAGTNTVTFVCRKDNNGCYRQ